MIAADAPPLPMNTVVSSGYNQQSTQHFLDAQLKWDSHKKHHGGFIVCSSKAKCCNRCLRGTRGLARRLSFIYEYSIMQQSEYDVTWGACLQLCQSSMCTKSQFTGPLGSNWCSYKPHSGFSFVPSVSTFAILLQPWLKVKIERQHNTIEPRCANGWEDRHLSR